MIDIIPKEIGKLKNLKVLDLGAIHVSGPIPHGKGNLNGLVKMGNLKRLSEKKKN